MIFSEVWADSLFITACVIIGLWVILKIAQIWAKSIYNGWLNNPSTPLDVDSFVDTLKNPPKYLKITFLQKMSVGDRKPSDETVSLASAESHHVPGLQVTERATARPDSKLELSPNASPLTVNPEKPDPLVIGTIRMGFGHHRIAYAACSWAMHADEDLPTAAASTDRTTYFHDLLNIDSPEADLIKATDAVYSKMSRITSNMGGVVEQLWGKAMLSGDGDALRISGLTAVHLRPLFKGLPLDTPIIATHCYVALAAVACGFTNVINLVIDNHAQWFVVVPGCLNLVQGPVNYQNFLKMGVKPENIRLAGHWIPRDLVLNIPADCARRVERAKSPEFKPRRILIPVGGAGAQRKFIVKFVRSLSPLVKAKKVQLFLNAGDHVHMKAAFKGVLSEIGLDGQYDTVSTTQGVRDFRDRLLNGEEPNTSVTLFSFEDYFPAVATTDILSRVADILACKPSELAFYPVPKLMIRRVGDHEQYSALRAAELGDGTLEAREIEDCNRYMDLFVNGSDLLEQMNNSIIENNTKGIYDGCKNAVKISLERSQATKVNLLA
mmetsp:Transcript_22298/g.32592  ORF Transcript_22298/g.32592 Transcript_22298/m.32592 type:complete len:552 (+) Transcript_22298:70-1725(+)|eukprot:CAMPEP_0197247476 /NCGR_PEP_ID=MMETSP1429-20130617/29217_1 /TAXON_ID=49237 /ORGANISM="Chaetoceros  sp., Strain UNC1202" /LENGTH=551 /DNA_ID=CAMNT_0042708391 /DNA_START=6 /DNA_END=1661 /DNA_ORIENTATION=-